MWNPKQNVGGRREDDKQRNNTIADDMRAASCGCGIAWGRGWRFSRVKGREGHGCVATLRPGNTWLFSCVKDGKG